MSIVSAITGAVPGVLSIIDKVIPDSTQAQLTKQQIELELMKVANEANKMQAEVNKVEAGHRNFFVAAWRPSIGWSCSIGVCYMFIVQPLLQWLAIVFGWTVYVPQFPSEHLMELTYALLGIAGLRTVEKIRGVTR